MHVAERALDHYFIATDEARRPSGSTGNRTRPITVSGIPTHPVFAQTKTGWRCAASTAGARICGHSGIGRRIRSINARRMLESLMKAGLRAQIVAVCGKNAALVASLESLWRTLSRSPPRRKVVGFTTEMDELMAAADLHDRKPGGLTTSESLIQGLGWVWRIRFQDRREERDLPA